MFSFVKATFFGLLIATIANARDCSDSLYSRLAATPIIRMTDGEYRYFRHKEGNCSKFDNLIDSQIVWLKEKLISEMSPNERDYVTVHSDAMCAGSGRSNPILMYSSLAGMKK